MTELLEAEERVRKLVRSMLMCDIWNREAEAEIIAGEVAVDCYHYLIAVAHSELAIRKASHH